MQSSPASDGERDSGSIESEEFSDVESGESESEDSDGDDPDESGSGESICGCTGIRPPEHARPRLSPGFLSLNQLAADARETADLRPGRAGE